MAAGARFCCDAPNKPIVSEDEEVIIIYRGMRDVVPGWLGFTLTYTAGSVWLLILALIVCSRRAFGTCDFAASTTADFAPDDSEHNDDCNNNCESRFAYQQQTSFV